MDHSVGAVQQASARLQLVYRMVEECRAWQQVLCLDPAAGEVAEQVQRAQAALEQLERVYVAYLRRDDWHVTSTHLAGKE